MKLLARIRRQLLVLPVRTVLLYWFFGLLWIVFSDRVLGALVPDHQAYQALQTYKGQFFIAVTGMLLYPIVAPSFYKSLKLSEELKEKNVALEQRVSTVSSQRQFIEDIYNASSAAIVVWDSNGNVLRVNARFRQIFDDVSETLDWDGWLQASEVGYSYKLVQRLLRGETFAEDTLAMQTSSGELKILEWTHQLLLEPETRRKLIVSFGIDKTREKAQERKIYQLAYIDKMTQLGNAALLELDLYSDIRGKATFMLVGLQLEGWQKLLSLNGQRFSDLYAARVCQILRENMPQYKIYRSHPDTFVFYVRDIGGDQDRAEVLAAFQGLIHHVPEKLTVMDLEVNFRFLIGAVAYPEHGTNEAELIQHLNLALKQNEGVLPRTVTCYDASLKAVAANAQAMELFLDQAIEGNYFELYFQPIVASHSETCSMLEVLLRCSHPSFSQVGIGSLIGMAEKNGQIYKIDRWVMYKVCEVMQAHETFFKDYKVSVNLSAQSFNALDLPEFLEGLTRTHGIRASQLILELTEHSLIDSPQRSRALMAAIKDQGFELSLDDFGTKYSSLNYLTTMPFDHLKLDKSYVDAIVEAPNHRMIIEHIIQIANRLNLRIIAEGVESLDQVAILKSLGCDFLQGYYYHRPMALDQLMAALNPKSNH